jgi:glycosyltransferase involved in cell wall biosynthesis
MVLRISFITFTRNCARELELLLRHIHDVVDEIIVVDGMSTDNTREIAKSFGAKVFVRKPWGHVEPDRMFALRVCSYNWVLYLDVDERLSPKLRNELRNIVDYLVKEKYVAAKVNSVQVIKNKPVIRKVVPWQIRIYDKRYVRYKGIVHELPEVKGKVFELDPRDYYIIHLKGDSWLKLWKHSVKYAYLERIEIYRMGNFLERACLETKLAPLATPLIIAEKAIRNPPLTLHSIPNVLFQGLYRGLVLTLMTFRGKRREVLARYVQKHGLIQLLKLY